MSETLYPKPSRALAEHRHALAPSAEDAFLAFSRAVFADGALPVKTKQLIAVAVSHVTQCPYCIIATPRQPSAPGQLSKN